MDLRSIPIEELLPQRPPFVMVDYLTEFTETIVSTELRIRASNIFFENGRLLAAGLIENIAQTCAARIGYVGWINHKPVRIGYIGAVRGLHIHRTPCEGELLQTSITVKEEIFGMTLVDAVVKSGNETLVEAEMKIALADA